MNVACLKTAVAILAATGLAGAATPAAAAKFVFDVTLYAKTVTTAASSDIFAADTTFRLIFEGPAVQRYLVTAYGPPDFTGTFGDAYANVALEPATLSSTPLDAEVRALSSGFALTGSGPSLYGSAVSHESDGVYTGNTNFGAGDGASYDYTDYTDSLTTYRTIRAGWNMSFGVPTTGIDVPLASHYAPLTAQDLLTAFAGQELGFALRGYHSDEIDILTPDPDTGALEYSHEYLVNDGIFYDGTAVLNLELSDISDVVAVPEPATWALMLTGFGLAGATLRRRRAAAQML